MSALSGDNSDKLNLDQRESSLWKEKVGRLFGGGIQGKETGGRNRNGVVIHSTNSVGTKRRFNAKPFPNFMLSF